MKRLFMFGLLLLLTVLSACNTTTEETGVEKNAPSGSPEEKKESDDKKDVASSEEEMLLEKSETILTSLEQHNWGDIADMAHPDGVIFSNYANVNSTDASQLVLGKEAINEDEQEIVWGSDINSGKEIVATKEDYVDNYLLSNVVGGEVNYETVTYNSSSVESGGMQNTIHENFPDAKYVEYYSEETNGNDWQALRFAFKEHEGEWLLFAIVRDVHSP